MEEKIQLIWDFRGEDALEIAKHHEIHLKEFILKNQVQEAETAVVNVSELYAMANISTVKSNLVLFRDALKPHRGIVIS